MADEDLRGLENSIWGHVRPMVVEALPRSGRDLLDEIEDFAGVSVGFRDMELLRQAGAQNTAHEALFCNEERAYISVPDPRNVNANAIIHEILHLQRYWLEQVPQLEAANDIGQHVELFANIDNVIEHLVVVPRERDHGYDPSPYWSGNLVQYFAAFPWPGRSTHGVKMACLLGWLSAQLSDDELVKEAIRSKLERAGVERDADRLLRKVREVRHSKPRMAAAVLKACDIPSTAAVLVRYDVRNRRAFRVPVPSR